jgi:hypothetical protein
MLSPSPIIGYFHICQKGDWKRAFHMIMDKIRESGLYNATSEIRCGVLTPDKSAFDSGEFIDPKLKIVYVGNWSEYERPTLLHMRGAAVVNTDPADTKYFYCHTKGLRWFGTEREPFVIDWIKLLIYWNIERWINAADVLNKYDTYGCVYLCGEHMPPHYSGNFFWTTGHHLKTLPSVIGTHYNDPEFWLFYGGNFLSKPNFHNAFSSNLAQFGGHYYMAFPESLYRK